MDVPLLALVTAVLSLCTAAFIVHSFPWLARPRLGAETIVLGPGDTPILVVSDLHLGSRRSLGAKVVRLIASGRFKTVVVAGDLVDERSGFSSKAVDLLEKLLVSGARTIIFVPSSSSHDFGPLPGEPLASRSERGRVVVVPRAARIVVEGCRGSLYVSHGDYASRNGVLAHLLDTALGRLLHKPFTGVVLRRVLGAGELDWVVHGHTHLAAEHGHLRIISTGCWVQRPHESMQIAFAAVLCRRGVLVARLYTL